MRLETERLVLRMEERKDIQSLVGNISNLKVSKSLNAVAFPYTLKDAESWFKHCKSLAKKSKPEGIELVIELKREKNAIGAVGLSSIDYTSNSCRFGYWLGEKYWRQGIMSEALRKVLDFSFNKLKLNRLEAGVFVENTASARLLEKLGFFNEGTLKQAVSCKATGKVHDEFIYAMLKEDYFKAKKS